MTYIPQDIVRTFSIKEGEKNQSNYSENTIFLSTVFQKEKKVVSYIGFQATWKCSGLLQQAKFFLSEPVLLVFVWVWQFFRPLVCLLFCSLLHSLICVPHLDYGYLSLRKEHYLSWEPSFAELQNVVFRQYCTERSLTVWVFCSNQIQIFHQF